MKKYLLTLILACSAAVSARAVVVFNETFNYADGQSIVVGTNLDGSTNWFRHSGSGNDSDVHNKHIEVSATGGTLSRQDDVHRNFTTLTNSAVESFFSFTVNCTNLPTVSQYFAHVYGLDVIHTSTNLNTSTNFPGRVFAMPGSLPGTWRLGISGISGTVNKIWPFDLAPNTDYQVVEEWDPVTLFAATIWVNPTNINDLSVQSGDGVSGPTTALGYGFRQASAAGNSFFAVSNLVAASTWDEAATNAWATTAVAPIIVKIPVTGTNFVGDTLVLTAQAAGQGQAGMNYQWQKDSGNVANDLGNTNVYQKASVGISDTGNYRMIATTPYGLSVTSLAVFRWVTNAPVPPTILPTTNSTVTGFYHQSATLQVTASGPPPISYQWYYTNAPANGANVSFPTPDSITISDIFTNNGTAGAYYCVASNPFGSRTSGVFTVVAAGPPAVSIAFLRTLVDPVNFVATNSSLRWQATGTVTTLTNLTTGDTSSYYLQDGTGGLNIFVTHGGGTAPNFEPRFWAPQQGDVVTFIGWLSSFNSTLELEADTNDITTGFTILSNNIAGIPPAKVIPFGITANLAFMETNLEGSIVMLTNVYFGTNAGTVISTSANTTVTVTNAAGDTFQVFFAFEDLDTAGKTLPGFANTVLGPLTQNLGNAVTPRNQNYQVTVTRFSDIVTNPLTLNVSRSGNNSVLTWDAAPYGYSYTVQAATNVAGPYSNVVTGLRFTTSSGTYTDVNPGASAKFYRLTTP